MQSLQHQRHDLLLPDVSIRQLRAFVEVADTHSFTRAANLLHYTEPGIYAQVKRLEGVLGCKLFERDGKNLRLTPVGVATLPVCRSMLVDVGRLASMRDRGGHARTVTVAAGTESGSYTLPPLVRTFKQRNSGIDIELEVVAFHEVPELVEAGTADFGVSGGLEQLTFSERLELIFWRAVPFSLVSTGREIESIDPIVIFTVMKLETPLSMLRRGLSAMGIDVYQTRFLPSGEAVKGACVAGLGYGLLSRGSTILERQIGVLCEVDGFTGILSNNVWICTERQRPLKPAAACFLQFLQEHADA